jgi:hypothetical protein
MKLQYVAMDGDLGVILTFEELNSLFENEPIQSQGVIQEITLKLRV